MERNLKRAIFHFIDQGTVSRYHNQVDTYCIKNNYGQPIIKCGVIDGCRYYLEIDSCRIGMNVGRVWRKMRRKFYRQQGTISFVAIIKEHFNTYHQKRVAKRTDKIVRARAQHDTEMRALKFLEQCR